MGRNCIWIALMVGVCTAAPSFATLTFQFDERGDSLLTTLSGQPPNPNPPSSQSTVPGVTYTTSGGIDELGGGRWAIFSRRLTPSTWWPR